METPIYFPEQQQALNQAQEQEQALRNQNLSLVNALNSSQLGGGIGNPNFAEFQLEADTYLNKLKHYLSGDIVEEKDGNIRYIEQPNEELRVLNKLGVNNYMNILSGFIGKETFLSVYSEERINEIIGDLGQLLRVETFSNAELYGLNTEYKITQFVILVYRTLVFIENAYRRSIGGREREKIGESGIRIIQSQGLGGQGGGFGQMGGMSTQMPKKKFSMFNSKTW